MIINKLRLPHSELKTLSSFISDCISSWILTIPNSFQREYSWSKKEIETLLYDIYKIKENNDPDDQLYLGRIVLSDKSLNERSIVDGQQRITTLYLLLQALANKSKNIIHLSKLHRNMDLNDFKMIKYVSEVHNVYLKNIGNSSDPNPINNGFNTINDILFNEDSMYYCSDPSWLYEIMLRKICFDVQLISNECEKDYFEDINGKGIKLSETDLLKCDFRNKVDDIQLFDKLWIELTESMKYLSDYKFSKSHGKSVFDVISGWVLELNNISNIYNVTSNKVIKFLKDFIELTKFTKEILLDSGIYKQKFSIIFHYSEYACIPWIWKLHNTKGIDFAITQYTLFYVSNIETLANTRTKIKALSVSDKFLTFDEFKEGVGKIKYNNINKVKGLLGLSESILLNVRNGSDVKNSFVRILNLFKSRTPRIKLTIEHIKSQSSGELFVNNIGNLTILTKSENSELQDDVKFTGYSKTEIELTKQLCKGINTDFFTQYDENELDNFEKNNSCLREHELSKLIYNYITSE